MKPADAVNLHSFFNGIGGSIIGIFVPVLIMMYIGDLNCVAWYMLVHFLAANATMLLLNKLCYRYPIIALIIHMVPLLLSPILLSLLPFTFGLSVLLGALGGIVHGMYYITTDNLQIKSHHKINLAKFDACCNLGHFVFAIMSAFILGSALENSLVLTCILAIIMYLCSIVPLILVQKEMNTMNVTSHIQTKTPKNKYYTYSFIFVGFFGVGTAIQSIVLPVYMFDLGASIELVGITFGLIYLVDIVVDFLGRHLRLKNKHHLGLIIYSVIFTLSMIGIFVLPNTDIILMIISTLCSLVYLLCYICMNGELMSRIKADHCEEDALPKINSLYNAQRIIMVLLFFIFPSYTTIFIFGIVCAVLSLVFGLLSMKYRAKNTPAVTETTITVETSNN